MFSKTSTLAAVLIFAIAGARAQCPNNGVGVGMSQLCNIGTPKGGSYCNDLDGFITTPGTWNEAAVKINLSLPKDMCGNGYTHGAFTTCDGSGNVISVNPPGAGAIKCTKQSEVAKARSRPAFLHAPR
ncbi:hypothetical protein B0H13DRAFT_1916974 [Mycena leptocephala]|nr:hypothetical protein B0H13DRAFT_1916974 [Mycena leptocephala]